MISDLLSSFRELNARVGHNEVKLRKRKSVQKVPELNLAFARRAREINAAIKSNLVSAVQHKRNFLSNNDSVKEDKIKQNISIFLQRINSDVTRGENLLRLARSTFEQHQREARDFDNRDGGLRIEANLLAALTNSFMELVKAFNRLQTDVNQAYREKMARQIRALNRDVTDEEIASIIKRPEEFRAFVEEKMYGGKKALQNVVSDIDEKLAEIKDLEENMDRLLEMIKSLHRLVTSQNEVVTSIEKTMKSVVDHVEKTHSELETGQLYMASAKEKAWVFFAMVLFIVIVLLNKILSSLTS